MIQNQIQPNTYTYVLMIRTLCKRDVEVQKTVAMLKRQSARIGHENEDVGLLESEGNLDKALSIFHYAVSDGVSVNTFEVEIFNQLLRVLSHYGDTSDANFVYSQLEQSAVQAKPNSATYAALINLFGRAGDISMALYYYGVYTQVKESLGPHDTSYIFNALVDCHLKCGLLEGALHVVEREMVENGIKLTCIPYNSIIRHYCTHNQMSEAEALIDRLIQGHEQDNTKYPKPDASSYGPILSAYCQIDKWKEATRIYDALRNTDITKAYGNLANYALLCLTHQDRDKALSVIEDMKKANLEPDPVLAERIVTSFAQAEEIAQAIGALHTLQQAMSPRSLTKGFHHLMDGALETVIHCESVSQVLQTMHMIIPLVNKNSNNTSNTTMVPSPYEIMSKTLIDSYFDQPKDQQHLLTTADFQLMFDAAFIVYGHEEPCSSSTLGDIVMQILQDMRVSDITAPSGLYANVLTQLQRRGDLETESRWKTAFERQISSSSITSRTTNVNTVSSSNKDYSEKHDDDDDDDDEDDVIIEVAVEDAEEQEQAQDRASASAGTVNGATTTTLSKSEIISNEVLKAIVNGNCREAIRIFEDRIICRGLIPTPEAMRDVIALSGKQGDIQTALTMYNNSIYAFKDIPDIQARDEAIYMATNSLLIGYAQKGDMDKAKVYYDRIKAMGHYPDSNGYASLLLGSAKCATDEATDALVIYDEAKRHNVKPTTFFYNVIISKLAKARKLDSALCLFDEMRLFKIPANSITYGAIISASVRSGSESQSRRLFGEMLSSPSYQPRVGPFNNMMQFYVRQHPNRERVLEYFSELRRRHIKPSPHSYKLLMEAYTHIAPYDMPMAHKLLSDMTRCDRLRPQATHYATLIYSYGILQRDVQSAERVFIEMKRSKIHPDEAVYQAMIDTLISNDALEKAEVIYYQEMQKDTQLKKNGSPYIENLFIRGYGEKGQLDKAEEIFAAMSDDKKQHHLRVIREPSTFEAMIRAYLENNKVDNAKTILDKMVKRDFPPKVVGVVADLVLE
jgi:pentatricopeptide repeat protein